MPNDIPYPSAPDRGSTYALPDGLKTKRVRWWFSIQCQVTFVPKVCIMKIMTTKDQLKFDLKEAMLKKDVMRKTTIRMTLAAIKNAEIDKGHELDDDEIQAILQKEVKSRRETIEAAKRAKRQDIITENEAEIEILDTYLPQQISTDEINVMAREAIDETGATSPNEIGQVMKVLMPRIRGQAEGKEVNQIVRKILV